MASRLSHVSPQSQRSVCHSSAERTLSAEPQFNVRPPDTRLADHLRIVREALAIERLHPDRLRRPADCRRCVEIIADVVGTKLCGKPRAPRSARLASSSQLSLDSSLADGADDMVEAHLEELKLTEFDCNVIPLGALRAGGRFERALLFKVLADQVGLPCVLHMDAADNRSVWTEVAIPLYDELPRDCGDIRQPDTPATTTHIVDLMQAPGRLYLIGCQRALDYIAMIE